MQKRNSQIFANVRKNSKVFQLFPEYQLTPYKELKDDLVYYEKFLFFSNLAVFILDFLSISSLYCSEFQPSSLKTVTSAENNGVRILILVLSLGSVALISIQYLINYKRIIIEYILVLRPSYYINKFKFYTALSVEIILHLLQPYPYLNVSICSYFLQKEYQFTLDMLLFLLSCFRFYTLFKVYSSTSFFFKSRSRRIYHILRIKQNILFTFKICVCNHPIITILILFIYGLLISGKVVKVFEDFDRTSHFRNILNGLWFVFTTMLSIGFGDVFPQTHPGRFLSVAVFFMGIFLRAIVISMLFMLIVLSDDNEKKAYSQINLLYSKEKKKSYANIYFTNWIKYKMFVRKQKKFTFQSVIRYQKMERIKEHYFIQVQAIMKIPMTVNDFCKDVNKLWDEFSKTTNESFIEMNKVMKKFNDFCCSTVDKFQDHVSECTKQGIQNVNLIYMIMLCGGLFTISNTDVVKNMKFIPMKNFPERFRAFEVQYHSKLIQSHPDNKTGNGGAHNDNSSLGKFLRNPSKLFPDNSKDAGSKDDSSNISEFSQSFVSYYGEEEDNKDNEGPI